MWWWTSIGRLQAEADADGVAGRGPEVGTEPEGQDVSARPEVEDGPLGAVGGAAAPAIGEHRLSVVVVVQLELAAAAAVVPAAREILLEEDAELVEEAYRKTGVELNWDDALERITRG